MSVTRWELGAYALSALLMVLAAYLLPIVRAVDPTLAVALDYESDPSIAAQAAPLYRTMPAHSSAIESLDPWGHPYRVCGDAYSVGPDGIDGGGDDIAFLRWVSHPLRTWTPEQVFARPQLALRLAALALALLTLVLREVLRAPRCGLAVEALRAAVLVAIPVTVGSLWCVWMPWLDARFARSGASGFVQVPWPLAIPLSLTLLCYLPALAWRLSRPRPEATLT